MSRVASPVDCNHHGTAKLCYQRHVAGVNPVVPDLRGCDDHRSWFSVQVGLDVSGWRYGVHVGHCFVRKHKLQVEVGVFVNDIEGGRACENQVSTISEGAERRMLPNEAGNAL